MSPALSGPPHLRSCMPPCAVPAMDGWRWGSAGQGMPCAAGRPEGRLTFSTCFCRLRTPLSLQYCLMSRVSTAADSWALLSSRPHRVRACGTRYRCGKQLSATPLVPTHHSSWCPGGPNLLIPCTSSEAQRSRLIPMPQALSVNPGCAHLRHHLQALRTIVGGEPDLVSLHPTGPRTPLRWPASPVPHSLTH